MNSNIWAENYTTSLNNLTNCYRKTNRFEESILFGEKVLAIREKLYNKDPNIWCDKYIRSIGSLAATYSWLANKKEKSLGLRKKAHNIAEKLYNKNSNRFAVDYTCLLYTSPSPRDS